MICNYRDNGGGYGKWLILIGSVFLGCVVYVHGAHLKASCFLGFGWGEKMIKGQFGPWLASHRVAQQLWDLRATTKFVWIWWWTWTRSIGNGISLQIHNNYPTSIQFQLFNLNLPLHHFSLTFYSTNQRMPLLGFWCQNLVMKDLVWFSCVSMTISLFGLKKMWYVQ